MVVMILIGIRVSGVVVHIPLPEDDDPLNWVLRISLSDDVIANILVETVHPVVESMDVSVDGFSISIIITPSSLLLKCGQLILQDSVN